MNDVQVFIERQIGLYQSTYYDTVLRRLAVSQSDSFRGISPYTFGRDYNPEPPIFACRFAECSGFEHILAIANEDGGVALHNTLHRSYSNDEHQPFEGIQCHQNAVFDLAWMQGQMSFVTVSGDHTARLWDINDGVIKQVQVFCGHTKSVKTAAFRPQDCSVFATGARDGKILLWDTRANLSVDLMPKPDNCIYNCHSFNNPKTPVSGSKRTARVPICNRANSITGLVFQDDCTLVSCGDGDGSIKVWDLRKNYSTYKKDPLPRHSIPYCGSSSKNGYTNLLLDKSKIKLFASCMDNVIYCFNISTYSVVPEQRYVGHENGTFYIKSSLSPDSNYIVSGSSDEKAYIWNVKYSDPIVKLEGHSAEVTCATWCQVGDIKIVTCSDDARHKIWRIGKEWPDEQDLIEQRGTAKTINPTRRANRSQWGTLDQTPQSLKRKAADFPSSSSSKKLCPRRDSLTSPNQYFRSNSIKKTTKRSLLDMMNNTLPTLKECQENGENDSKKMNLISQLEPVSSDASKNTAATTSKCSPDECLQRNSNPSSSSYDCGENLQSPPLVNRSDIFKTPTKSPRKLLIHKSPVDRSRLQDAPQLLNSPTINLPNFVIDGNAPHLGLMSPQKRPSDSVDWLTKMSRDKRIKTDIIKSFNSSPPTNDPADNSPQSRSGNPKKRRNSDTPSRTPRKRRANATLLNYFSTSSDIAKK